MTTSLDETAACAPGSSVDLGSRPSIKRSGAHQRLGPAGVGSGSQDLGCSCLGDVYVQFPVARSDGLTPFLNPPNPKGDGLYSPTIVTSLVAGILSSRPTAQ